jgi:hypothetical protein
MEVPGMRRRLLPRLQDNFVKLVKDHVEREQRQDAAYNYSSLAKRVGVSQPILSRLLSKEDRGKFKKVLSEHYVIPFILEGIFTVKQLYGGISDLNATEQESKTRLENIESKPLMDILVQLRRYYDIDELSSEFELILKRAEKFMTKKQQ